MREDMTNASAIVTSRIISINEKMRNSRACTSPESDST